MSTITTQVVLVPVTIRQFQRKALANILQLVRFYEMGNFAIANKQSCLTTALFYGKV